MKEALYDILDGEYCFLLDRITKVFKSRDLNSAIVGGAAAQIHISNFLSKVYKKSVEDLFIDGDLRPQDHIRGTDDIDVVVYNELLAQKPEIYHGHILRAIDELECTNVESPDKNDIYDISIKRKGLKRPILLVKSLNKLSEIKMNVPNTPTDMFHLDQSNYVDMIKNAETIVLPYNSYFNPEIRVYSFDDVLASKIMHNRPKDHFDALVLGKDALIAGREIDRKRILHLWGGETEENLERLSKYFKELESAK